MNILIIDSGGTKAHWAYMAQGRLYTEGTVPGIHPFFLTEAELAGKIREIQAVLPPAAGIRQVFHYGTGTNSKANHQRLTDAYLSVFPEATIAVESDLLAVARALCGRRQGIAAIMGTGSNVGLYNGEKLVSTAGGLGYVLGDEGSGAHLGKTLLNHYLNGLLPTTLSRELESQHGLTRDSILESVYRKGFPNRYLASMAPFLAKHLADPAVADLARDCFRAFFRHNILPIRAATTLPLSCSGSIAFHFAPLLREVATEFAVAVANIAMSPMEGLLIFHTQ